MNEPSSFSTNEDNPWFCNDDPNTYCWNCHCPTSDLDDPEFIPQTAKIPNKKSRLSDKTICMVTKQGESNEMNHYDVHSLYGWSETRPTMIAAEKATGKRPFVISRST